MQQLEEIVGVCCFDQCTYYARIPIIVGGAKLSVTVISASSWKA